MFNIFEIMDKLIELRNTYSILECSNKWYFVIGDIYFEVLRNNIHNWMNVIYKDNNVENRYRDIPIDIDYTNRTVVSLERQRIPR
jgi:hypothetical protein